MLSYDISKAGDDTLYHFLYRSIKDDILSGRLEADAKLPSKRPFANALGVSVVTVENAYEQLLAEGFIYSLPRKGFFVAARLVDGYADGSQSRQVHEQVVDEVTEAPVVVAADDGSEGHAVLSSEGVVADEGVETSVVRRR